MAKNKKRKVGLTKLNKATTPESSALKLIFDSIGLTRQQIANELGVTRDSIQRMIRGDYVPLHRLSRLKDFCAKVEFECDLDPKGLNAVNFRVKTDSPLALAKIAEIELAGLSTEVDKEVAYRTAMFMRADLKRFNDSQLRYELELRGYSVMPKPSKP